MNQRSFLTFSAVVVSLSLIISSCTHKASIIEYRSDGLSLVFPEDSLNLQKTAICFSGGGTRALTSAAGQMKALDSIGVWDHIGYMSSVSGGSWASSIFTYYVPTKDGARNDKELLGTPLGAKNLSIENLKESISPRHMIHTVTNDFTGNILNELLKDDFSLDLIESPHDIWIDAVGSTYLKHFGLYGGASRYFTLNKASMNDIIARNPKLKLSDRDFYIVHDQEGDARRPYLVMNSSISGPSKYLPLNGSENLTVFNYSPLGVGSALFKNVSVDSDLEGQVNYPVGGGFIEPFAMTGSAPIQPPKSCGNHHYCAEVKVHEKHRFKLADAIGASSAAFAATLANKIPKYIAGDILALGSIIPEETYWPNGKDIVPAGKYRFDDGGSLDNYGVITMLQRDVNRLVVFINTDTPIDTSFVPGPNNTPNENTCSYDFYTLFHNYTYPNHNHNQVFSLDYFVNVFNDFKSCIRHGKTVLSRDTTTTIQNDWWGIPKGQKLEILWFYNSSVPKWEVMLSDSIQHEIELKDKGMFPHFPWYKTLFPEETPFLVRFSPAMAKLLYELQFYNVYENRHEFNFLKEEE